MMEHKVDVVCSVPYTMAQLGRGKETAGGFSSWPNFLQVLAKGLALVYDENHSHS